MNDRDRLLGALGAVAREQEAASPPATLLQPPSREAQERLLDQVLRTGAQAGAGPPRPRRRFFRGRTFSLLLVPVALAAGLLLWMPGRETALPAYVATVSGGLAAVRSAPMPAGPGTPTVLEPGAPLEVVLRPMTEVVAPVEARALWRRAGEVRPWVDVVVERSDRGSFRLRGTAERPFGPGDGALVLVVAPAGRLPGQIGADQLRAPPAGWQVMTQPVRWR